MTEPVWNKFLTERDKAVFDSAGYGTRGGYGKKPALIIIDVNYNFCRSWNPSKNTGIPAAKTPGTHFR